MLLNWSTSDLVTVKTKRVNFFETQCCLVRVLMQMQWMYLTATVLIKLSNENPEAEYLRSTYQTAEKQKNNRLNYLGNILCGSSILCVSASSYGLQLLLLLSLSFIICTELRLRDVLPDRALLSTVAVIISSRYIIYCSVSSLRYYYYALWTISEHWAAGINIHFFHYYHVALLRRQLTTLRALVHVWS